MCTFKRPSSYLQLGWLFALWVTAASAGTLAQETKLGYRSGVWHQASPGRQSSAAYHRKLHSSWLESCRQRIQAATTLPDRSREGPTYFVDVADSGKIREVQLVKSSGLAEFDQVCEQALTKSAPLPPPLDHYFECKFTADFSHGKVELAAVAPTKLTSLFRSSADQIRPPALGGLSGPNSQVISMEECRAVSIGISIRNAAKPVHRGLGRIDYRELSERFGGRHFSFCILVKPDGTLSDCSIIESSGSDEIDKKAVGIIEAAAPFHRAWENSGKIRRYRVEFPNLKVTEIIE